MVNKKFKANKDEIILGSLSNLKGDVETVYLFKTSKINNFKSIFSKISRKKVSNPKKYNKVSISLNRKELSLSNK